MKKSILTLISIAFLALPIIVNAQAKTSSIDGLYKKYSEKEGFTTVNISTEMFRFIAQMQGMAEDEESKRVFDAISKLNGLKIITLENPDNENAADFKNDLQKVYKKSKFIELMTVKEKGEEAKFLLRKDGDKIIELLLLVNEGNEQVAISFFGLIDLETIAEISKSVNLHGMPNLDTIKGKIGN